ncbi:non-specific lipid-transfer protein 2-like [Durio zibethinus]|uniref:Non-specific lipid-transfer protein 2-like n=1 Tax=Durio zibethinus TaxID=66656 RepID=A0A6P6AYM3_DURZI|nr:non-specific lipid-transfer protein 2-like [Durio zibethinus]
MKRVSIVALCAMTLMVVLFSGETRTAEAVTCDPSELSSCLAAFTSSSPPSTTCCSKLKAQQPCLCGYLQNPALKQFVNNPNAKKVASTCGVAYPKC